MAGRHTTLRLFVGISPSPEAADALLASLEGLELPPHRCVRPEQIHLTLQFIGDTPVKDLEATIESVRRAAAGLPAFPLTPRRQIALPVRGPARLIATETDAPATLMEIQRRLVRRLARQPRRRPGDRFLPHLTLCRFRAPTRIEPADEPLSIDTFAVTEIRLMKSSLNSDGAVHECVEAVRLTK